MLALMLYVLCWLTPPAWLCGNKREENETSENISNFTELEQLMSDKTLICNLEH